MSHNKERAIGCIIGYNSVIKSVKYFEEHNNIDPRASRPLRRVLEAIYGQKTYMTKLTGKRTRRR